MANELKIKQKHEDFVAYAYVALKHMPKSERFTLVADIKNSLFRILELIIRANKTRNRLPVLYDLELLRTKVKNKIGHFF